MSYTFSSQRYSSHTPTARLDYAVSCWRQVGAWPLLTDMAYRYLMCKYRQRSFSTLYWVSICCCHFSQLNGYRRTRNLERKKLCPLEICLRVVRGGSKVVSLSLAHVLLFSFDDFSKRGREIGRKSYRPAKSVCEKRGGKCFRCRAGFFFSFFFFCCAFHFSFETYKEKHGLFVFLLFFPFEK